MSAIEAAHSAIPEHRPVSGYQALSARSENRSVSVDTRQNYDARERMAQTIGHKEEQSLIDATKDIGSNLFAAFKNELRGALSAIGIGGNIAADLVRDIAKAFAEAVRNDSSFSFSMIAAAYKETLVQTSTSVSHSLEFSAKMLSIDYNHATGELSADTSKLEIDAVKSFKSDNLPFEARALFDFTDSEGMPTIATLFDRVQQYLATNGFTSEGEDASGIPALPTTDQDLYDKILINDAEHGSEEAEEDDTSHTGAALPDIAAAGAEALDSIKMRAIEEFTNARQETITRMTFDMSVRVYIGKDAEEPEQFSNKNESREHFEVTV